MNVLVLGGGGREHALVWKMSLSPLVKKIYCIPGNAGIEELAECDNVSLDNFEKLTNFAKKNHIDLTIVGSEQPLVNGIVDYFEGKGLPVFGPNKAAAQLEGSKVFAKNLMNKYDIPTASFQVFSNAVDAMNYLKTLPDGKIVIKADGLAAGKGSIVCQNKNDAAGAIQSILVDRLFKEAGKQVVIEECMEGEEASIFVLTDGVDFQVLSPAQDYKRALDNDQGKNTGGMGSYSPVPFLRPEDYQRSLNQIVKPVLAGLESEGIVYKGVLYVGLMLTKEGPKVVEFNCRFGDPETQVVLPLLETDLLELLIASVNHTIGQSGIQIKKKHAVCVVAASGGYPDSYDKGKIISGLRSVDSDVLVFHAGTKRLNGQVVTNGGRVLGITAIDDNIEFAVRKAYENMKKIRFEKIHYRQDIAKKALRFL